MTSTGSQEPSSKPSACEHEWIRRNEDMPTMIMRCTLCEEIITVEKYLEQYITATDISRWVREYLEKDNT